MSRTDEQTAFVPIVLTEAEARLVYEARGFARANQFPPSEQSPTRGGFDRDFSEALARHGWVGMTISAEYGGSDRSGVERCLVISELLAAGAPLGAHWTADRQTAPSLMINGPESLRRELLPRIAAGRCLMAGGFSEPDAGSDLASVRTRARKVAGGWVITGRKIWTTDAERADFIEVLCRTSDAPKKHDGLSLIIVPMDAPGLSVHAIEGMDGSRHFNEVVIDEVYAPDDWLVGQEGSGWRQLTAELALERAGPERFLTTFPLFESFVESRPQVTAPERSYELIGRVISQQMALRQMTLSIARLVDSGGSPVAEAAMAKDLGTELEQLLVDELWHYRHEDIEPGAVTARFQTFLDINRLRSPVFTTAGGTNEVLRTLVSRELGAWATTRKGWAVRSPLSDAVNDRAVKASADLGSVSVPRDGIDPLSIRVVAALRAEGFFGVGVPPEVGGGGGSLSDALDMIRSAGYAGVSTPLAAGSVEAGWLLARAGLQFEWDHGMAVLARGRFRLDGDDAEMTLSGTIDEVAWPEGADMIVAPVERDGRLCISCLEPGSLLLPPAVGNIAGEPVVRGLRVDAVPVSRWAPTDLAFAAGMEALELRRALAGAVGLAGALQRTAELAIGYAAQRVQFGQPIARFQAVQTHLCRLASEAQLVAVLVDSVQSRLGEEANPVLDFGSIAAARSLAGRAAIVAARTAHQVHGAIGVTMEYPLQRLSRRLWEWEAMGEAEYWSVRLGERAVQGNPGPWDLITGTDPLHAHDLEPRR